MRLPRLQFGMKSLFGLILGAAVVCACWPHLQPFAILEAGLRQGGLIGTEKTYVWHSGLAIKVTKFAGEWPSFRRCTDIDVQELERDFEEAIREDAEEARRDALLKAR